jgi:regulation of enolase protein 1 (concanavalin A-like superfamily)
MWGPPNNATNVLVRSVPDPANEAVELTVVVENTPTHQYEQVNLVWYYGDSHMVKLGLELVDGEVCVVMGREQADRTRTIAKIPVKTQRLRVRLTASGNQIRGQYQLHATGPWQDAGSCDLPVHGQPHASLQVYQGDPKVERWARITEFRVSRPRN